MSTPRSRSRRTCRRPARSWSIEDLDDTTRAILSARSSPCVPGGDHAPDGRQRSIPSRTRTARVRVRERQHHPDVHRHLHVRLLGPGRGGRGEAEPRGRSRPVHRPGTRPAHRQGAGHRRARPGPAARARRGRPRRRPADGRLALPATPPAPSPCSSCGSCWDTSSTRPRSGFLGALASRMEEASNASTPVTMVAMLSYFAAILLVTSAPDGLLAHVLTFIPPSAPWSCHCARRSGRSSRGRSRSAWPSRLRRSRGLFVLGGRISQGRCSRRAAG